MKRLFILFFLRLLSTLIFAQSIELKGIVIDSITSLPIAYAGVGVKRLGIGTLTNEQGKFILKVPNSAQDHIINIQILGYKSYSFTFRHNNQNQFICKLSPSPIKLEEVTVVPRDTLLNLLRLAYKNISRNYPVKPQKYTGFYREVQKANDTLFLNFTEAILDVYKQGYDGNSNLGQIRIIKSRKNNFPGTDTINNVRFYGGPHLAHTGDFVFKRSDFINPRHFKNYSYWLSGTQKLNESEVYIIGFKHHNDSIIGTLFIDRNSLAYIELELFKKGGNSLLNSYIHKDGTQKTRYFENNGKWYLSHVIINTSGENTKLNKKVLLQGVYVTTSLQTDSVKAIPYDQEISYTDVISIEAEEYTQTTWKDYNILAEDSSMSALDTYSQDESIKILSNSQTKEPDRKEKFFSVMKHFTFSYGIEYLPLNFKGGMYQMSFSGIEGVEQQISRNLSSFTNSLGLYTKAAYIFNKHSGLYYSSTSTLHSHLSYNIWDIGLQYGTPIFRNNRKWFIDLSLGYSHSNYYYDYGNFAKISDEIKIDNKTFNAKEVGVFLGVTYAMIKPSLTFSYKLRNIFYIFLTAAPDINLNSENVVKIKEKSGFILSRKSHDVPLKNNQIQLSLNGVKTNTVGLNVQPFRIAMGLSFKF